LATSRPIVFLFDVDNTLLNNDRVAEDLQRHMTDAFGAERQKRYWVLFEELREQLGYTDYLGALQRYRIENPRDPHLLEISSYLIEYPFANRLYPESIDALEQAGRWGTTVLLTDGDAVFQPRKLKRSGLGEAVNGRVLIYVHKEEELADVERRYPAEHYVLIDDKIRILAAAKQAWGERLTTVFPRQGRYALDAKLVASYPPADVTIDRIGDFQRYKLQDLLAAAKKA
jgi:FMN phosphatase YigB (HAD superfamily)